MAEQSGGSLNHPATGSGVSSEADELLLDQAAAWPAFRELSDCASPEFAAMAAEQGLDFATSVLFDRIQSHPTHGEFTQQVRLATPHAKGPMGGRWLAGIIPGAFYQKDRKSGAGGAGVAAALDSLHCPWERIPVENFGPLERNAAIIADWLRKNSDKTLVLVSLSKGTLDARRMLAFPEAAELLQPVVAWLSLSGLPLGTPLEAWLHRQVWRRTAVSMLMRWRGFRYSTLKELRHETASQADWSAVPPGLRLVHAAGFPLRHHLAHPWAGSGYERVAPLGPNDGGGFLLSDLCRVPGLVFPIWGADHYMQPSWDIGPLLRRLLSAVISPEPR